MRSFTRCLVLNMQTHGLLDPGDSERSSLQLRIFYSTTRVRNAQRRLDDIGCAQHPNDVPEDTNVVSRSRPPTLLSRPERVRTPSPPPPRTRLQLHRRPTRPGVIFYDLSIEERQEAIHVASFNFNAPEQSAGNVGGQFHVHVFECLDLHVPIDYLDAIVFYELDRAVQDGFIDEEKGEGLWKGWVGKGHERMVHGEDTFWDD